MYCNWFSFVLRTTNKSFSKLKMLFKSAQEIDMVINISMLKDKEYDYVENEIHQIVEAAKDKSYLKSNHRNLLIN